MSPDMTGPFQDDLRHESCTVPSDLKWAALRSRSAGTTAAPLHVLALCITLGRPSVEAHVHWTQWARS